MEEKVNKQNVSYFYLGVRDYNGEDNYTYISTRGELITVPVETMRQLMRQSLSLDSPKKLEGNK